MSILIKRQTIKLNDYLGQNLLLRASADKLFDYIDSVKNTDSIIDFDSINSMSRSFAQQFLYRLEKSENHITYANMSENLIKMFDIVREPKEKSVIVDVRSQAILL